MYKYLLFDVDGTLIDFLASESHAIKALFSAYGLGECTDQMVADYSRINVKHWHLLELGQTAKPQMLVDRFREFFGLVGVDPSIAPDFNRDYQLALGDHCELTPHAWEVLAAQKGHRILAAITNGTKVAQAKKLAVTGLDQVFDAIYISEAVGAEKPSAVFFDHVTADLGICDRAEALIIGDSLTSDMRGGLCAGIDTCWYNPGHAPADPQVPVTYEIDDLGQLEAILR